MTDLDELIYHRLEVFDAAKHEGIDSHRALIRLASEANSKNRLHVTYRFEPLGLPESFKRSMVRCRLVDIAIPLDPIFLSVASVLFPV